MTTLPPEIEKEGWRVYERARAFENLRRRRLPLIYGAIAAVVALAGALTLATGQSIAGAGLLGGAAVFEVTAWLHWRALTAQHGGNLTQLAELERKYGRDLPWLLVERQMAQVAEIQREQARKSTEG